jgi:F0F1-type ATP synthase membrane subunit b/b'
MTYQRNPLAGQLLKAHQNNAQLLEANQHLQELLADARHTIRQLRADKTRLQARNADLKRYRPHAPHELAEPLDEAEARLRAAANEVAQWHRQRRAA